MSYNSNGLFAARSSRYPSYQIEQSLRFGGGQFIGRGNPASTATSTQTFTHSFWVKRGSLGSNQQLAYWVQGGTAQQTFIAFDSSDRLNVFYEGSAGATVGHSYSTARYRDPSAWYHVVWATDTTQATSTDRWKLWVNGEQVTTWDSVAYPSQNLVLPVNHTGRGFAHGTRYGNEDQLLNGYIAESYFVDGQFLDQNDFGEYDDNGVWRPIEYTGTFGARGWYLPFAASDIYSDESGNSQDFDSRGDSYDPTTSGTDTDVMSDTPTTNYATLDPVNVNNNTSATAPYNGNLDLVANLGRFGTIAVTSGKWYWEVTLTGTNSEYNYYFGAKNVQNGTVLARMMCNGGNTPDGNNISGSANGTITQPTGSRPSLPATIGVKLDMDNGDIEFVQGGVVNGKMTGITNWGGAVAPYISSNTTTFTYKTATFNFGQRAFSNTIPTGYSALNTANLPASLIKNGSDHLRIIAHNQGSSFTGPTFTGLPSYPVFIWAKRRTGSGYRPIIFDRLRGTNMLDTSSGGSEFSGGNLTSWNNDGFTLQGFSSDDTCARNNSFVYWVLIGGATSGSSNTDGTITSTVITNPSAGFSIATYTGNGTSGATIGHGLGVAPAFAIFKARNASTHWLVYHQSLGATKGIYLSLTLAAETDTGFFNNTAPTSTVMTMGNNSAINVGSQTQVAYFFAEVEGYSKFGSYTGNGSSDGPFVALNFRPAWLMIKRSDSTESWLIFDSTRETYNPTDDVLWANLTNAESANYTPQDFLSNGIKIRTSSTSTNASGGTYIFAAFAENPFGGSNVSPATAR